MTRPIMPSFAEVLRHFTDRDFAHVSTAFPGLVLKYDAEMQAAQVKPLVFAHEFTPADRRQLHEYPVLPDIPVVYPRFGKFFMAAPLKKGDHVLCVVCESSIGNWRVSQGDNAVDPEDHRRFSPAFAVAIPGCMPDSKLLQEVPREGALTIGVDGGKKVEIYEDGRIRIGVNGDDADIEVTSDGQIHLGGDGDAVALASKVLAELEKIKAAVDEAILSAPKGGGMDGGAAAFEGFKSALNFDSPGSTNVKAE